MSTTFKYTPLSSASSFRVLLIRGAEDRGSKASCMLVHRDLESPPQYSAISYTWEGQSPSEEIALNGCSMLVTANCHAALKRCRPWDPDDCSFLWIDSVCIDQSEEATAERNIQVGMMGDIYSKATKVLVFLNHSRMREFPNHRKIFEWLQNFAALEAIQDEEERSRQCSVLTMSIRPTEIMDIFHNTPWFHRLWTVQEVVLARASLLIWDDLELRYPQLVNALTKSSLLFSNDARDGGIRDALSLGIGSIWFATTVWRGDLPPSNMLRLAGKLHASRPHDKMYALHGLLDRSSITLPAPDYSVPVDEVYRHYTVAMLKSEEPTFLLDELSNLTDRSPSWVHDWSMHNGPNSVAARQSRKRSPSYDLSFAQSDQHLLVKGIIVDEVEGRAFGSIVAMADPFDPWNETMNHVVMQEEMDNADLSVTGILWDLHVLQGFLAMLLEYADQTNHDDQLETICETLWSRQNNPPTRRGHFWRMLEKVSGLDIERPPASASDVGEADPYQPMPARLQAMKTALQQQGTDARMKTQIAEQIFLAPELQEAFGSVTIYANYQTVFRTKSGRVGMAPHTIRQGDQIFMFVGSQAPAVVRAGSEGRYRWVAQAYVHGLMDFDVYPEDEEKLGYVTFE